jgi:hypothetical protein
MGSQPPDTLRELADRELAAGAERARAGQRSGLASALLIDELARRAAPPKRSNRWITAGVFLITLSIVSLLLTRVSKTDVALTMVTDEFAIRTAPDNALFADGALARQVEITGVDGADSPDLTVPAHPKRVRVSADNSGAVRIAAVGSTTPPLLRMALDPERKRLTLEIAAGRTRTELTLSGKVSLQLDQSPMVLNLAEPATLVLTGDRRVTIDIAPTPSGMLLKRDLAITEISTLAEIATGLSPDTAHRVASSQLRSGTLSFEEFGDRKRTLRGGERLQFAGFDGYIDSVQVTDKGLSAVVYGSVEALQSGLSAHPTNLMPTRLEWLTQRHQLALLWGSAVYVFGLLLTLGRWLSWPFKDGDK